jgi:nitroreductase
MDAIEAIMTTRAIRRFSDEPITDEEILTCLRAAMQAPSGGNVQPWQFVVVRDGEAKRAVADVYKRAYDRYQPALLASLPPFRSPEDEDSFMRSERASRHLADNLGQAQAIVLFCMPDISLTLEDAEGPMDIGSLHASVYPAVQNLMVAARALGIGTVLTTVFRIYQKQTRDACGVPDHFQIVALVPMGRPTGRFGIARRKPAEAVTHWDAWGNKRR